MSATSDDPSLASVLSELFDCVVQQKDSSVVKGGVKLGWFVGGAEDSDPKVQAKYTATMEEVKAVSGWGVGGGAVSGWGVWGGAVSGWGVEGGAVSGWGVEGGPVSGWGVEGGAVSGWGVEGGL